MLEKKNILIGVVLIAVLAAFIGFRAQISKFLSFGSPSSSEPIQTTTLNAGATSSQSSNSGNGSDNADGGDIGKPSTEIPYTGRPLGEIRPIPEEVKLFSEAQKQEIYASIKRDAETLGQDPSYFEGWIHLGILKKTIGDFIGAKDAWEYAGLIQPKNSLSFANLGELYWRYIPDYPKSEQNLKTSVRNKPDDTQTYVTLAELYHYSYKEKYDLADNVLLDGLKSNPDNQTLMRRLAYLYEQRKEYAEALKWWEKILLLSPGDQEVMARINEVKGKIQ